MKYTQSSSIHEHLMPSIEESKRNKNNNGISPKWNDLFPSGFFPVDFRKIKNILPFSQGNRKFGFIVDTCYIIYVLNQTGKAFRVSSFLADGCSPLKVPGETTLHFFSVIENLDVHVLAGIPFME